MKKNIGRAVKLDQEWDPLKKSYYKGLLLVGCKSAFNSWWENRILVSYTIYKAYKIKSEQLLGEAKLLLLLISDRNFSPWSS
jgi:hypothetical protein